MTMMDEVHHPLYMLLHDAPNPEMSSFVFRETLMTHQPEVTERNPGSNDQRAIQTRDEGQASENG